MKFLAKTMSVATAVAACVGPANAQTAKAGWVGADTYRGGFYQNVTAKDLTTLLAGHVRISENQDGRRTHKIVIQWFGRDGKVTTCAPYTSYGRNFETYAAVGSGPWVSAVVHASARHETYPLLHYAAFGPNGGYTLMRYDPKTGGMTDYTFHRDVWHRDLTGRLQKELPAVTWKLCRHFPSAARLGATVDPRQTSSDYDTIIRQGGTPILRPDLVTAKTVKLDGPRVTTARMMPMLRTIESHDRQVLVGPNGHHWAFDFGSGSVWFLSNSDQVLKSGNYVAASHSIDWSDGTTSLVNPAFRFKPTGKAFPLAQTYHAFIGHRLHHAVGPLPKGTLLDANQTIHVPHAKSSRTASTWTSWGQQVLVAGPWGDKMVPAAKIAAAAR